MINGGQMDRQEALKQEEEMLATIAQDSKQIRNLLENEIRLSRKEADRILSY
jgi:hypothetical protein